MKRNASFATAAALVGSLVGTATQAQSTLCLVPISDLNKTYAAGSTVKFAAVLYLGTDKFVSFTVPAAVAYLSTEFGSARPTVTAVTQAVDPNSVFDLATPPAYSTTASKVGGATLYAIQPTLGHSPMLSADGVTALTVPAGTYTIATFSFPIQPTITGNTATVYLPTPFGFSNSASSADGAFQNGVGPTLTLVGKVKNASGNFFSEPLTFPNDATHFNSLTFKVAGGIPYASLTGTLQFDQLTPNAASQNVLFQFRDPVGGAALFSQIVSVPPSGVYALTPVPTQPYTIWIKPVKYLARTAPVVVSGNNFAPISLAFEGGDANNDNSVDTSDFGILVGAYGGAAGVFGSGYDVRADFNSDGYVDPTDFAILVEGYGETGAL